MPDLLLELFSEEIPARMQKRAAQDLRQGVTKALVDAGVTYEGAIAHATPRRLVLHISGMPPATPHTVEIQKGPRLDSPEGALLGFAKKMGLSSLAEAQIIKDPKGDFYAIEKRKEGRRTEALLQELLPAFLKVFPWPKAMRWGTDSFRWVRPLSAIVCVFSTEDGSASIIPFQLGPVSSGDITYGHRFMAPGPIRVTCFETYLQALTRAFVVVDAERRQNIILAEARSQALARGLELIEDPALLEEVAGLVEYPVVHIGQFSPRFLEMPSEVIQTAIRTHQKCFVLKDIYKGTLSNHFVVTANLEAEDGGAMIVAGNIRVLEARLSDAKFFWTTDLRIPLGERVAQLESVTFHKAIGTQLQRVRRLRNLACTLASALGADVTKTARAAQLAKADLLTGMVQEFPELQGIMGSYYARAQGESPVVAAAIADHYRPQGFNDAVPEAPVSCAVALADKIDLLTSFWSIGAKPTGSKDPFALRRAAIGILRIILHNRFELPLRSFLEEGFTLVYEDLKALGSSSLPERSMLLQDLLDFLSERLKVLLKEQGLEFDLIEAVLAAPERQDDLLWALKRASALKFFLKTPTGANLIAGWRRAVSLLQLEEKKDKLEFRNTVALDLLKEPAERYLVSTLSQMEKTLNAALEREDLEEAVRLLADLRGPIDAFFDQTLINVPEPDLRHNRLCILAKIRGLTQRLADFSLLQGGG